MTDITPENVARMLERLRVPDPCCKEHHTSNEAADMLEALAARLAEVEAKWLGANRVADLIDNQRRGAVISAEVTEAKLAAFKARVAKLRADYYSEKERLAEHQRAALEENKP
jgi:hypothetical protein